MNCSSRYLHVTLILGLGFALALVWMVGSGTPGVVEAQAGTGIIRVATTGQDIVGCGNAGNPCRTVQYAVDRAQSGEEIRVAAGIYSDVQGRQTFAEYPGPGYPGTSVVTQVVYIDKTVTVRGGYTTTNAFADPPNPEVHPTTLDAQGQGRVLAIFGNPSGGPGQAISPMVEGFRITGGDAAGLGGGEFWLSGFRDAAGGVGVIAAALTLSDCWVFSNTANVAGGVGVGFSTATLIGNTILSNTADYDGGGVGLSESTASLIGNTILSNTADHDGGGIVTTGCDGLTLVGNRLDSNTANAGGGGLYMDTSTAILSSNVIMDNIAVDLLGGEGGGGVYLWESQATISGTTILSNIATWYGGGVYLGGTDEGSMANLVNSIVADNRADHFGSGLFIENSSLVSRHATIARNTSGDGSGLYVTGYVGGASTAALTNTILVSHTVGITVAVGCTATLEATLWAGGTPWANEANWGGPGTIISSSHVMMGNPAFVDPDRGDYHIGPGSAAIDQGVNAGVTIDIDGEPRPSGAGTDLGADELYHPALEVTKRASSDPVEAGAQLTYTLAVTNTGNVPLHTTIVDKLPAHVTPGGTRTWNPVIPAPGVWHRTVVVTVDKNYNGTLTNVVSATSDEGATGVYTDVIDSCVPLTGVDLSWEPSLPHPGQQVQFTAWVTPSVPVQYTWDLGGLAVLTGNPVMYTFPSSDMYSVQVTAQDGCGKPVSTRRTVSVAYRLYLPLVMRGYPAQR
jgi:uncharacterized repeat protein (TIGR01451 family)